MKGAIEMQTILREFMKNSVLQLDISGRIFEHMGVQDRVQEEVRKQPNNYEHATPLFSAFFITCSYHLPSLHPV